MTVTKHPVLLSDPRIAAIRWGDDGEPMIDLEEVCGLWVDRRLADPDGHHAHLRRGVVDRLLAAQSELPQGLQLLIIEGYRPPTLQRKYFEDYRAELAAAHPDWSPERCHIEASKFVSPPEVAPHGTGGAVDLTLCTSRGVELDLGTPVNASPEESQDRCYTDAFELRPRARELRDILSGALASVGLVNYPTEWWHWSYGDRYWALTQGLRVTRYAPVPVSAVGRHGGRWRRAS